MIDKQLSLAEYVNALGDPNHRATKEYCDLIREVEALREQRDQWIPVSERLPDQLHQVNLTDGFKVVGGWRDVHDDFVYPDTFMEYTLPIDATHWMPLPQPPTAEEN